MKSATKSEVINKKAHFDYAVLETLEAGIQLLGWEVKSLRSGRASLKDAHVRFINGEPFLVHAHVTPYQFTRSEEIDETRSRKLLLHKKQALELKMTAEQRGLAIIPLKIYLKNHHLKVLIGLAKGKKVHEKRAALRERDIQRDAAKEMKWRGR